jgi:uncharacterized glyoxalase superfamily protein PhnB
MAMSLDGFIAGPDDDAENGPRDARACSEQRNRRERSMLTVGSDGLDGVMRSNRSIPTATVIPVLSYPDVRAAVAWLGVAFGFIERVRIGDGHRAQLSVGEGAVIVADAGGSRRPPDPSVVTHSVMVRVSDVDAQCERALRQDAIIVMEPTEFPYGERQCTIQDPWGHQWTFSQTLDDVVPEEWGGETVVPA